MDQRAQFDALWERLNTVPRSQYGNPAVWLLMAQAWMLWFWMAASERSGGDGG